MKDFEALKNIWQDQAEPQKLNSGRFLKKIRSSKHLFANKLLKETAGMLLAILVLVFIWSNTAFALWTTHLSMLILIVCCLYYLFVQFGDFRSISNSELMLQKPDEYISYLKSYKRERYILNTRKYTIYSVFIGIAFALYFIEIYFIAELWQTIAGIILTIAWFILCYFLMRIYIRREQLRLSAMIGDLERLQKQFETE